MFKTNFFFAAILCCLLYGVAQAQIKTHYREEYATREHVVANHERRREQLRKLLADTKEKVVDHEEGRNLLEDDEEYALLTKRIGLYEKKLEKMEGDLDEREIDRLVERARARSERRHIEL